MNKKEKEIIKSYRINPKGHQKKCHSRRMQA